MSTTTPWHDYAEQSPPRPRINGMEQWLPGYLWDRCVIMPLRCSQCCRYLPSDEAVEDLLKDVAVLCDDCEWMQAKTR